MLFTRRNFVQIAGVSLAANSVIATTLARALSQEPEETFSPERMATFSNANFRTFQTLIGYSFAVSSASHFLGTITLIAVETYQVPPSSSPNAQLRLVGRIPRSPQQSLTGFTLKFQGTGTKFLQDTYTLYNSGIGALPLLLVPSGASIAQPTYSAVFNFLNVQGHL